MYIPADIFNRRNGFDRISNQRSGNLLVVSDANRLCDFILCIFGRSCREPFLLLPFQVSILGFITPGVSSTNLFFNVLAIPSGVYRLWREKRMLWPLVALITAGTLPGLVIGVIIRVKYLPDPANFKLFAGLVLLYLGIKLLLDVLKKQSVTIKTNSKSAFDISNAKFSLKQVSFSFENSNYAIPTVAIFTISILIGVVGGIYGVGGGAFLVPILVTIYGLPIYTIAGAALASTFLASLLGVILYTGIAPLFASTDLSASPDWLLGLMLGVGGMLGIYIGSRTQRFMPVRIIKIILMICILIASSKYILNFII